MTPLRRHLVGWIMAISISGCYTVLRESGEYYSEFQDGEYAEYVQDSSLRVESEDGMDAEEVRETVIIERYYDSPWCPPYYPYSGWWVSVGYAPGYVHVYEPLWHWSYYTYGSTYWAGCWYPTVYTGPDYYYPRTHYPGSYSRRDFGVRTTSVNTSFDSSPITTANRRATAGSVRFKTVPTEKAVGSSKQKASRSRDNARRSYKPKNTQTRSGEKTRTVQPKRDGSRSSGAREYRGNSGSNKSGESKSSAKRSSGQSSGKRKYN